MALKVPQSRGGVEYNAPYDFFLMLGTLLSLKK